VPAVQSKIQNLKSKIAALLLLVLLAIPLEAQGLPGLQQFEVENARLILLDKDGNRRGNLEGKLARKKRDGNIEVQGAVLTMTGGDGKLVVRADSFVYTPATEAFECPSGLKAELPDGGGFELPQATGTISIGATPVLKARGKGEAEFRSSAPDRALLRAKLTDPDIEIHTAMVGTNLGVKSVALTGLRGGEILLRVASLPAPDGRGAVPGVLALGCFGDISATFDAASRKCEIRLLRRARMGFDGDGKPFEITAAEIKLRGSIAEDAMSGGAADLARSLGGLEIDASGTVHVTGPTFQGFGNDLTYREPDASRELTLLGNPSLDVDQTTPRMLKENRTVMLRMKSRNLIALSSPLTLPDQQPDYLTLRLESGVQLWRESSGRVDWRMSGRLVSLHSVLLAQPPTLPGEPTPARREHFRVESEGYSPLLRVAGQAGLGEDIAEPTQRAAVFGASAMGRIEQSMIDATVAGPDILALLYSEQRLADEVRYALGLRHRPKVPQPRPGRLTVRASDSLRIRVAASGLASRDEPAPLDVSARGAVELEHAALPRDDRDFVSFTGDSARLAMKGSRVTLAELRGDDCLATLGYDLLVSRGFQIHTDQPLMDGLVHGPGRMVIREQESLLYFRRAIERLPRRGLETEAAVPDAGWMNFAGDVRMAGDADARTMEVMGVELNMVLGEFEIPRAGKSAVKDLPELLAGDVRQLYLVRGKRMLLVSTGYASEPPAVVNLLRLEGDALIRSEVDRLQAMATESIEATGADDQRAVGNPLAVVLLGRPVVTMEDAGLFFGDVVRKGSFSYDSGWRLTAGDRLELTFRPLAVGDPVAIAAIRHDLAEIRKSTQGALMLLERAWRARTALERLVAQLPSGYTAESEQPRVALRAVQVVEQELRNALAREHGGARDQYSRARASRNSARAENLLAGLVEIAASGGVEGEFSSRDSGTPALNLGVERAVVTFNGVGEIVDTNAQGAVRVARGEYVITGSRLTQARDGTLLLDDAQIRLPANTGMEVTGVKRVSMRQMAEDASNPSAPRTMVTRITGQNLKVGVKLTRPAPKQP